LGDIALQWPKKTQDIQYRVCDSTYWDGFKLRDDDIIIASWSKAGTTWTQQVITQLRLDGREGLTGGDDIVPWLDGRNPMTPLSATLELLEAQTHRRLIKTHLPARALTINPRVKYIYVGRDVRDIIWSAHNHVNSWNEQIKAVLFDKPPIADVRAYYHDFLDGGASAEGPAGRLFDHVRGWWALRHLPNLFFVHFANLKKDLAAEAQRIARYLDIPVSDELLAKVTAHSDIDYMREAMAKASPHINMVFKEGAASFFNKGTNGRWRDVLSPAEIAKADEVAARELPPDCAHWLKTGELPRQSSVEQ
jgi:aryl sulfotransferase